ncbi:hypothetical protein [Demequina sp.]|uniref:hypothetical protein n=1 Tax=Demequina sp. TaxID=2050685 RepID=UPI003D0A26B3
MTALHARLDAAVDVDSMRFNGGEYADARFGAVKGRIARRRAARSAGIGGASLVGVGAVAFGAGQVPWSGFVLGSPAGGGEELCTPTPGVVVAKPFVLPTPPGFGIIDEATSYVYFVDWDADGNPRARNMDGSLTTFETTDGRTELVLESGARLLLPEGGGVQAPEGVTAMPINDLEDVVTPGPASADPNGSQIPGAGGTELDSWLLLQDGEQLAKADFDGSTLTFAFMSGETVEFDVAELTADEQLSMGLANGGELQFMFDGGTLTIVNAEGAVTCESQAPSASPSASVSPSVLPSVSESAVPTTSPAAAVDSPFYCKAEIATEEHGDADLQVTSVTTVPSAEVNAEIDGIVENIGDDFWDRATADEVLKVDLDTGPAASDPPQSGAGSTWPGDPRDLWDLGYIMTDGDGAAFARGLGFVAVRDGVVVGVLPDDSSAGGHVYEDGMDPDPSAYLLTPDDAFEACPGVDLGDDWDMYAVAGEMYADEDGVVEAPVFAWKKIDLQG